MNISFAVLSSQGKVSATRAGSLCHFLPNTVTSLAHSKPSSKLRRSMGDSQPLLTQRLTQITTDTQLSLMANVINLGGGKTEVGVSMLIRIHNESGMRCKRGHWEWSSQLLSHALYPTLAQCSKVYSRLPQVTALHDSLREESLPIKHQSEVTK